MNETTIYYSTSVIDVMSSNLRIMRERVAIDMDNLETYDTTNSVTGTLVSSDAQNLVNRYEVTYDPDFEEICDLIVFVNESGVNCGFMRLYDTVDPSLSKDFQITLQYTYTIQYNNIEVSYAITRNENVTDIVAPIYDDMHSSYYDADYIKTIQVKEICNDYEDEGLNFSSSQFIVDGMMLNFMDYPQIKGKIWYSGLNPQGVITITSDDNGVVYVDGVKKLSYSIRSNDIQFTFNSGYQYLSVGSTKIYAIDYNKILTNNWDLISLDTGFVQKCNLARIYMRMDLIHGIFAVDTETNLPLNKYDGDYLDSIHPNFKNSNQRLLSWSGNNILSATQTDVMLWYIKETDNGVVSMNKSIHTYTQFWDPWTNNAMYSLMYENAVFLNRSSDTNYFYTVYSNKENNDATIQMTGEMDLMYALGNCINPDRSFSNRDQVYSLPYSLIGPYLVFNDMRRYDG